MPLGHAAQFPQRVLQSFAQTLEALRKADRHRFPVRVRQHAVIHQVVERLTVDGHRQLIHRGEVGGAQSARSVHLREEDLLRGPSGRTPVPHAPLQRAELSILELTWIARLQPAEQRLGLERRFGFQVG
jgi:hypothetical protein